MIDLVNLQRKVKLDTSEFRIYIGNLSSVVSEADGKTLSVAFVSDKRMTELNKFFRGKDSTTDVLSFPHETDDFLSERAELSGGTSELEINPPVTTGGSDFLGDIVISAEQAERQAKENKLSLENEIKQLILHGLLHLCGYDHETDGGEMNRRELDLRKKLKI
jgi:probable rRNA maturation factor